MINPADESSLAEVAYGDAGRGRARHRGRGPGVPGLAGPLGLRPGQDPQEDGRADARAGRPDRPGAHPGAGQALLEAKAEVLHAADTFEWFAEEGKRAYGRIIPPTNMAKRYYAIKHPVGVVGTITPWNFPAALPSRKIAPALAVGLHGGEPAGRADAADPDPDVRVPGRRRACRRAWPTW